jgi:hypothetical protein
MARFQELAREAQACGADLGCISRVQQKMQAFGKELGAAAARAAPGVPPAGRPKQVLRQQQLDSAVRAALQSREDDACYAVAYQKQVAQRLHGSKLPWLNCVPLQIEVKWRISEFDGLEEFDGTYEVTQTYPGYLAIERSQQNRLLVLSYRLVSPAPQGRARPANHQSAGSAALSGVKYHGILAARPYEKKTFGTGAVADFAVADDGGSLEFVYERARPSGGTVIAHQLQLWGPKVSVSLRNNQAQLAHSFWQPDLNAFGDRAFTRQDIEDGLKRGKLTRRFALQYEMAYLRQSGSAEVTILFNHEPGRLVVTPDRAVNADGPRCDMSFSPSSMTYTLKNAGDSPIAYRIDGATGWVALSKDKGVLNAGKSTSVRLTLDGKALIDKPGSYQTSLQFINTSNGRGNTQRALKLSVKETQEWQVRLGGHFEKTLWTPREILTPGASKPQTIKDIRNYRFDYQLGAKAMIEKRKGKWQYTCGSVTASDIKHSYQHTPANLWKVTKIVCLHCATIKQMKGAALSGAVNGNKLRLLWKNVQPALEVSATLAAKCWQNPKYPGSCGYSQKGGTAYYEDNLFMINANGHNLPLKNQSYKPGAVAGNYQRYKREADFTYTIKQLR